MTIRISFSKGGVTARHAIEDPMNLKFVSVASLWEIANAATRTHTDDHGLTRTIVPDGESVLVYGARAMVASAGGRSYSTARFWGTASAIGLGNRAVEDDRSPVGNTAVGDDRPPVENTAVEDDRSPVENTAVEDDRSPVENTAVEDDRPPVENTPG